MTTRRLAAISAIVGLSLLLLPQPGALGAPTRQPSRSQVQGEIERLADEIATLDEDYNEARIALARVQREMGEAQERQARADAHVNSLRRAASARAVAVYRAGLPDLLLVWLTSRSPAEFDRKMAVVSKVGDWESGLVSSLRIAKGRAAERASDLDRERTRAKKIRDAIDAKRDRLEDRFAAQQQLLKRIDAAEAAARAAAERAAKARAAQARAALQARSALALPNLSAILGLAGLPVSPRARVAVETALDQAGKPYHWGSAGPDSFDCSGLTMFAWRAAGVSLPHSSRAQFGSGPRVARDDLQPGDLVFFGRPIRHVGLYIGNGQMVNAPETGEQVGVRSMERRDYVGAVRPGI